MPYILSPIIEENSSGMWLEGDAYLKKNIYSIQPGKLPPVNYDEHTLKPHSLTHLETAAHTQQNAPTIEYFYENDLSFFYGKTVVLRLKGNKYRPIGNDIFHWEVTKNELIEGLNDLKINPLDVQKLLVTTDYSVNKDGYHDPNFVLTLSQEAADFLITLPLFNLYGTSWKSSDFNPGKSERPIHNTIFKKALILENLKLEGVPEGIYFMTAFPLPLKNASESPVVPILFNKEELLTFN